MVSSARIKMTAIGFMAGSSFWIVAKNVRACRKKEAERLGLTTATLILRMARLEIDRAEPDQVENMPRNNPRGKPN